MYYVNGTLQRHMQRRSGPMNIPTPSKIESLLFQNRGSGALSELSLPLHAPLDLGRAGGGKTCRRAEPLGNRLWRPSKMVSEGRMREILEFPEGLVKEMHWGGEAKRIEVRGVGNCFSVGGLLMRFVPSSFFPPPLAFPVEPAPPACVSFHVQSLCYCKLISTPALLAHAQQQFTRSSSTRAVRPVTTQVMPRLCHNL